MVSDPQKAIRRHAKTQAGRWSCGVEDPKHAEKLHAREPGDPAAAREQMAGRRENAMSDKSLMHGGGESSGCIVPTNGSNKLRKLRAEGREGRRLAKEIRRQGPDLDTEPEEPGALYCQRNGPRSKVGDVIIRGGNRVR